VGLHQLLVSADDPSLLVDNMDTKKKTQELYQTLTGRFI
jgi:hypothetical protein